jgi:hypothetical protein
VYIRVDWMCILKLSWTCVESNVESMDEDGNRKRGWEMWCNQIVYTIENEDWFICRRETLDLTWYISMCIGPFVPAISINQDNMCLSLVTLSVIHGGRPNPVLGA